MGLSLTTVKLDRFRYNRLVDKHLNDLCEIFIAVYCDFIVEDRADGKVMHLRHLGFCRSRGY